MVLVRRLALWIAVRLAVITRLLAAGLVLPHITSLASTHDEDQRENHEGGVSGQESNAQKSMPSLSLMQRGRKTAPICSGLAEDDEEACNAENQANKAFLFGTTQKDMKNAQTAGR